MKLLDGTVQFYCVPSDKWSSLTGTQGTFTKKKKILERYNRVGMDVYFVVNTLKRDEEMRFLPRKLENVLTLRAIWQEDDNDWKGEFPAPPHYVVETSPGHFHRYWVLQPNLEANDKNLRTWKAIMDVMVEKYGSDPGAKDITRIMRVPGFKSHKRNGFEVKLIHDAFDDYYKIDHLAYMFGVETNNVPLVAVQDVLDRRHRTNANDIKVIDYKSNLGEYGPNTHIDNLKSGEHVHSPIRGIMMHMANKGHDMKFTGSVCTALLHAYADPADERFEKAVHDIPSMLRSTWRKIEAEREEVDIQQFVENMEPKKWEISFPEGLGGKIMKYVYMRMQHPSMGMAFTITLGFLSSFLGRRFNVLGSGLSTYQIVFAPTGYGKGQVFAMLKELTRITCQNPLDVTRYFAASGFTSPKALCNELQRNMCSVSLIDEFGKYLASGAGDPEGVTRFLLEAYSACGSQDILKGKAYSSDISNTPDLFAPALSIIGLTNYDEGTDKMIREAKDGFIPRCHIINLRNTERQYTRATIPSHEEEPFFSEDEIAHLKSLRDFADAESTNTIPSVINVEVPEEYYAMKKEENDLYNRLTFENEDSAAGGIIARSTAKVLRIAALFAICDCGEDFEDVKITKTIWTWASFVVEQEKIAFNILISQTQSESLSLAARALSAQGLIKFFTHKLPAKDYDNQFRRFKEEHLRKLLFTPPVLNWVTRNKVLRKKFEAKISAHAKLTMPEAIIKHWLQTGVITDVSGIFSEELNRYSKSPVYRIDPEALNNEAKL